MVGISTALKQIGDEYKARLHPNAILKICRGVGYLFRQRVLGPVETVRLFLLQVLHGNTPYAAWRHLDDTDFTDSAYCQARKRLSLSVLRELLADVIASLRHATDSFGRWRGHRVFHLDGSSPSSAVVVVSPYSVRTGP